MNILMNVKNTNPDNHLQHIITGKVCVILTLLACFCMTACGRLTDQQANKFQVPQSPLLRSIERKSGLIAYVGIDGNIYTMDQAGKNIVQLTNDATTSDKKVLYYTHVTWAPNGNQIAYVSYSGSSVQNMEAHLYVSDTNGTNSREVFAHDRMIPIFLYWAPNSKSLAFLATQTDGNSGILRLSLLDGQETIILDSGQPLFWAWAPSSKRLLIHSNGSDYDSRISYLYLGENIVEESLSISPASFQAPIFSPKGDEIMFAGITEDEEKALITHNRLNSQTRALTIINGSVAFDYSPNGKYVAYIDSNNSRDSWISGTLNVMESQGSKPQKLSSIGDNVIGFFWSPNGEKIAYFKSSVKQEEIDGVIEQFSYLELHVLSIFEGTSKNLFSFVPSELFAALLPYIDQYQRTFTIWSPDSQYLALSAYTEQGPAIVVAQSEGDFEPRILEFGMLPIWSWK